jgi:hypothetical protein
VVKIRLFSYSRKVIYAAGLLLALVIVAGLQLLSPRVLSPVEPKGYQIQGGEGISINSLSKAPAGQVDGELSDIAHLGFTRIRLDIRWSSVQAHTPEQYNWGLYDPVVAAASRYHLQVLGILDYAPSWGAQSGCLNRSACAPKDPAQFADFAAQTAKHYKLSVNEWEIWNEENSSHAWSPAASAQQYAQTLKDSYRAIKQANPRALVVLGGMAPGDNLHSNIDAVAFLRQLYQAGAGGSFDAVGYHPYTYPRTPFEAHTAWDKLAILHSIMQAHGDGAKQIWITEYGAPTGGPVASRFVSEADQALLARDAYTAARREAWIGPFFWYTYQDRSTDTSTSENFFGLRRADGSEKPSYAVWKQILAM